MNLEQKLQEYQRLTIRTEPLSHNDYLIAEFALGLICETGEVADILKKLFFHKHPINIQHIVEELGDTMWYLSAIANHKDIDLSTLANEAVNNFDDSLVVEKINPINAQMNLSSSAIKIAQLAYSNVTINNDVKDELRKNMIIYLRSVYRIADSFDLKLTKILTANIEKLNERYQNGFSSSASIKRVDHNKVSK